MPDVLNLDLPQISFDSDLLELIVKLEVLRNRVARLEINPRLFIQVKEIFYMIESLQSARIEGNRTTISDYVTSKFESPSNTENIREINNIEKAISYVNKCFSEDNNFKISTWFIKELHSLITNGLQIEGSQESGKFRTCNVKIKNALHTPPESVLVPQYMDRLVEWINQEGKMQQQLLKVAIAHHAFTWIHPFDNGNGRMSRILTYSMLKQYGFDMAYLLNSTAVFCIDRNKYFDMLQKADENTDEGKRIWCEYVLNGLYNEMSKVSKLMQKQFFTEKIVMPAINRALELHFINNDYKKVLELVLKKDFIKSADVQKIFEKEKTTRQITSLIAKMVDANLLEKTDKNARTYTINLLCKDLTRGVIDALHKENFICVDE